MNTLRITTSFIGILLITATGLAKPILQEVRTASNKILVLYFTDDTTDIHAIRIDQPEAWKINGTPADQIYRFATGADACDHYVYLETSILLEGKTYTIETPYGNLEEI